MFGFGNDTEFRMTMISNLVTGVTQGFKKELEITGVGYRAQMQGQF